MEALLKVIVDGQAWLYAAYMTSPAVYPGEVTDEIFEAFEDEWKTETVALVERLVSEATDSIS